MGYQYYRTGGGRHRSRPDEIEHLVAVGRARLSPRLTDPNYLVYRARTRLVRSWLGRLGGSQLEVLGVGSRIEVYRPLLDGRIRRHVSVDPQIGGLVDVVGVGEHLPFPDRCFDLVICTQVLSYVSDPWKVAAEIHRVLRADGVLILSAPALFPRHHDERWRFLPDGLRLLLDRFSAVEVYPEGHSISGLFRTANVGLELMVKGRLVRWLLRWMVYPLSNLAGRYLDGLSRGNDDFVTNYSAYARK